MNPTTTIRDQRQRARICRALIAPGRDAAELDALFTVAGPTPRALALYQSGAAELANGNRILFLFAMSIWTDSDERAPTVMDLFRLDQPRWYLALGLLDALAEDRRGGLEDWIEDAERHPIDSPAMSAVPQPMRSGDTWEYPVEEPESDR